MREGCIKDAGMILLLGTLDMDGGSEAKIWAVEYSGRFFVCLLTLFRFVILSGECQGKGRQKQCMQFLKTHKDQWSWK